MSEHTPLSSQASALRPLRQRPTQARAQNTVAAILSAAADLLTELGWEGFNTNLLADRAGYRVATVYRYFPDKLAVVSTLAEQVVAEWDRELASFGVSLQAERDIRRVWIKYLRTFIASVQAQPGALAVRRAMQAAPELRAIDQADNARLAKLLGDVIGAHMPSLSRPRAQTVARLLIETAVAAIDLAHEASKAESKRILLELETMHLAYFDQLGAPKPED